MVGQLWCWIINEGEARMCLFFPILQPREISFAVGSIVLSRIMICFDGHANGPASEIEWVGQYSLSCGYGRVVTSASHDLALAWHPVLSSSSPLSSFSPFRRYITYPIQD